MRTRRFPSQFEADWKLREKLSPGQRNLGETEIQRKGRPEKVQSRNFPVYKEASPKESSVQRKAVPERGQSSLSGERHVQFIGEESRAMVVYVLLHWPLFKDSKVFYTGDILPMRSYKKKTNTTAYPIFRRLIPDPNADAISWSSSGNHKRNKSSKAKMDVAATGQIK